MMDSRWEMHVVRIHQKGQSGARLESIRFEPTRMDSNPTGSHRSRGVAQGQFESIHFISNSMVSAW